MHVLIVIGAVWQPLLITKITVHCAEIKARDRAHCSQREQALMEALDS